MSIRSTKKITRKQAIQIILDKRLELTKKEIKLSLEYLTDKELEELLDYKYYESEFDNYEIIDKEGSEE